MTRDHRIFYLPPPWPEAGGEAVLPPEESRHALRALRVAAGDTLRLVDGQGQEAQATALGAPGEQLRVRLGEVRQVESASDGPGSLAIPWIRSPARLDWAVEKATELGVGAVFVFAAERTVKSPATARDRCDRWTRVASAAMKQSGRALCPRIVAFDSLAALLAEHPDSRLVLADPRGGVWPPKGAGYEAPVGAAPDLLVVGPEGGWTPREAQLLENLKPIRVTLGVHRLRTETAAVALCTLLGATAQH